MNSLFLRVQLEEAAVMKRELIKKGLVVADDGQQFGWGEEQCHLGHSEIFCRYNPYDAESDKAVQEWRQKVGQRAIDGHFAVPNRFPIERVGPHVSNPAECHDEMIYGRGYIGASAKGMKLWPPIIVEGH
jgi:hypothetical protein